MAITDKLSDKTIKAALRAALKTQKSTRIGDGGGLYFEARPNGSGWWRLRFMNDGKEGMVSLGTYPVVSLKLARERRDEARRRHQTGVSPSVQKKTERAARDSRIETARLIDAGLPVPGTFEHTGRAWHDYMKSQWSIAHRDKTLAILEADLFPFIGKQLLKDITPPAVLKEARRIESRGAAETAYRAINISSAVFRFGVQAGLCASDPSRDLKGAIVLPLTKHRAAITEPAKIGELLRAIHSYRGSPVVRAALALAPLVFLRPGELRHAEWSEVDLDGATWTIPAGRMKGRLRAKKGGTAHMVPLAPQAVEIFRQLQPVTGDGRYVFPTPFKGGLVPISYNAVLAALRRMDFEKDEMSGHGFRAMARTVIVECLQIDAAIVEAQLAHAVTDSLGRAYNRTQFLEHRRQMMNKWADYLDALRIGSRQALLDSIEPSQLSR